MRSLETPDVLTRDRRIVTVGAKRFHSAEVLFLSLRVYSSVRPGHHTLLVISCLARNKHSVRWSTR